MLEHAHEAAGQQQKIGGLGHHVPHGESRIVPGRGTGRFQPLEGVHFRVLVPGAQSQKITVVQDGAADEPPARDNESDAACQQPFADHFFPLNFNAFAVRFLMDKALHKDGNAAQQKSVSVIIGHGAQAHTDTENPAAAPVPFGLHALDPGIHDDARRQKRQGIHVDVRVHEHALGQEADEKGKQQRGAAFLKQPGRQLPDDCRHHHAQKDVEKSSCHFDDIFTVRKQADHLHDPCREYIGKDRLEPVGKSPAIEQDLRISAMRQLAVFYNKFHNFKPLFFIRRRPEGLHHAPEEKGAKQSQQEKNEHDPPELFIFLIHTPVFSISPYFSKHFISVDSTPGSPV